MAYNCLPLSCLLARNRSSLKKELRLFIIIILSTVILSASDCSAQDLTGCRYNCGVSGTYVSNSYLGDQNGNPLPACFDCSGTGNIYLWVTIYNQAAQRDQAYVIYALDDGKTTQRIQTCLSTAIINGQLVDVQGKIPDHTTSTKYRLSGLSCGGYKLTNMIVTWVTGNQGVNKCPNNQFSCTCPTPSCDTNRNSAQCSKLPEMIVNSPPFCGFTTNSPVCEGNPVIFYSPAGQDSYSWDFGDGTTSSLQTPSHTYAGSGTYNVHLTTAKGNCPPTNPPCSNQVYVKPKPTANANVDQSICVGRTAYLSGIANYGTPHWEMKSGAGTLTLDSNDATKATYTSLIPETAVFNFTISAIPPCIRSAWDIMNVTVIPKPDATIKVLAPT